MRRLRTQRGRAEGTQAYPVALEKRGKQEKWVDVSGEASVKQRVLGSVCTGPHSAVGSTASLGKRDIRGR